MSWLSLSGAEAKSQLVPVLHGLDDTVRIDALRAVFRRLPAAVVEYDGSGRAGAGSAPANK